MKICFVSNYINHHQIPFCDAMYEKTGGGFTFIQTQPMEEERVRMGWKKEDIPSYVRFFYEEEAVCRQMILDCDVLLFGGCDDESYIQERLQLSKMIIRISERLYKTGQWKAITPRGLLQKYKDHTQYRKAPVYLLCAGGYVASDFRIVRAYPDKMFCWGYFPRTMHYDVDALLAQKGYGEPKIPYLLWAARMIGWKHPERALEAAKYLKSKGIRFRLDMVGGGELEEDVRRQIAEYGLEDCVFLPGYRTPDQVRGMMEQADVFLMTSDREEGWGAVANEAMNSGCALVADHMTGAAPYLISQGENGCVYESGNQAMLNEITEALVTDAGKRAEIGRKAYETIVTTWNAETAAENLMQLIMRLKAETEEGAKAEQSVVNQPTGALYPCAPAPIIGEKRAVPPVQWLHGAVQD